MNIYETLHIGCEIYALLVSGAPIPFLRGMTKAVRCDGSEVIVGSPSLYLSHYFTRLMQGKPRGMQLQEPVRRKEAA